MSVLRTSTLVRGAQLAALKGGALKLGQALSVLEAVLPEELAGPYRTALNCSMPHHRCPTQRSSGCSSRTSARTGPTC